MLYGFGSNDGKTLARWVMLDLNAFRSAMLRGLIERPRAQSNRDGTGFEAFDVRNLRGKDASIILAASYEIPIVVAPPPKRETAREFWKRIHGNGAA